MVWILMEPDGSNLPVFLNPGDEIKLQFGMPIRLIKQDKRIRGCGGKIAVTRGPIVYCLESIDNSEDIFNVLVDPGRSTRGT